MTLTTSRPTPIDQRQAEALIREARHLQHHRWGRRLALVLAFVVVAAVVFISTGRGGPLNRHHRLRLSAPPTRNATSPSLGLATAYQLTGPEGVAVDAVGDLYFTDGNRVYRVDNVTHHIRVNAGTGTSGLSGDGGPGPHARLAYPSALTVASDGDVYFMDTGNQRVRKVSARTGIISTIAGNGDTGSAGNGDPAVHASLDLESTYESETGLNETLAIGPHGDLYIADSGNNEIRKVSLRTGIITSVARIRHFGLNGDGGVATAVCAPVGIAFDRSENLFVATGCGAIREIAAKTGRIATILSILEDLSHPTGLGVTNTGHAFVTGDYGVNLAEVDPKSGTVTRIAGTRAETFPAPHATAGDGGPAIKATFGGNLTGVTVDRSGNTYIADWGNNTVRKVDAKTGIITAVAGQIPTSPVHCC